MSSDRHFPQRVTVVSSLEIPQREFRLDPTRYNERGERIIRHFKTHHVRTTTIGNWDSVSRVFVAPRFKRPYVESEQYGTPFLGSSSMLALRLPRDYLLSNTFKKLPRLMLHGGEVLLSCSGTIGVSVLCGDSYDGFAVSQHAARIYAHDSIRGYLHAFLSSDVGRELVLQQNYGKVIKELTETQIENVTVPLLSDSVVSHINGLMVTAAEKYDDARRELNSAENAVRSQLESVTRRAPSGLWSSKEHGCFLKPSDSLFSYRMDPHFNQPDVLYLRNAIKRTPHILLGDIADIWMPGRFARPSAEPGYGVPFYTSADMMRARRTPSSYVAMHAKRYLEQCEIETGMTLICRSGAFGGIMGRATYVSPRAKGWAVTEDMVRCKVHSEELSPEYVFAVLSSLSVGYPMITSFRYGKDVPHIDPDELGSIPVPRLTPVTRDAIASHVGKAYAAVDEGNALEEQAVNALLAALKWCGGQDL